MLQERIENMKKIVVIVPVLLAICLLILSIGFKIRSITKEERTSAITSSRLIEVIDISELSVAEFNYNGIAELFKDKEKKKIKCRIKYYAKVKASINPEEVTFEIDENDHIVKPILPEIHIDSNVVDEKSLSFMPSDVKADLADVLSACEEDALREAKSSGSLLEMAEENLKDTINALIYPLLDSDGYNVIWD